MEQRCEGESPQRDQITSDCVETTAYTLLALLEVGDTDRTGCLAQWLIKQQNSFGSFGSSQVKSYTLGACVYISGRYIYMHIGSYFNTCMGLFYCRSVLYVPWSGLTVLCQLYLLQDTIIGLKALAAFSRLTFTPEISMTFEVETESLRENILINNENRYVRHKAMVRLLSYIII